MGLIKTLIAAFMAITGFIGIGGIFSVKIAGKLLEYTTYGPEQFMAIALGAIIVYIMLE